MSDPNFSAIRARLRYTSIEEFVEGYGRYISRGGMFVPMAAQKLKPVGTTVRFQFLLADGTSAMLGEGLVRQLKGLEGPSEKGPVGMLVKFTKLSPESKELVDKIVARKSGAHTIPVAEPEPATQEVRLTADSDADEESASQTGVLAASAADALRSESGSGEMRTSPDENQDLTAEVQLSAEDLDGGGSEEASGDEIFGADSGEHSLGDDPSTAVAEALADDNSDPLRAETPLPASPDDVDDEQEDGDDDPFGGLFDDGDEFFDEDESESEPHQEPESEPEFESEPEPAPAQPEQVADSEDDAEAADDGPRAIKETEGGIKVMAFDENDDNDEEAARGFEEFASSEDEEFDEMFDNIFGGGDGGDDPFGGGGDEGADDFFSAPVEEADEDDFFDIEPDDEPDEAVAEEPVAPEAPVEPTPPPEAPQLAPEPEPTPAPAVPEPELEPEPEFEPEPEPEPESEPGFELDAQDSEPVVSIREDEGDSSERIRSLLSMEESEGEADMMLNLGVSSFDEESSESDDDEDDSMESLLANAQKEIESKQEQDEKDEKDILDELLGDDELPPAGAGAPSLNVPQPTGKKKKKGFMSKFFGDKD